MEIFNNREIAIAIWSLTIFFLIISRKEFRKSIFQLLKISCSPKIIIPFMLLLLYSIFVVFVLKYFHLWYLSNLKETIYWFVFSGVIISFRTVIDDKTERPFKKILRELITFAIILEFIVNTHVFALPIEILFLPIVLIITGVYTISSFKEEYREVEYISGLLLAIIGIIFIFHALLQIFYNFKEFSRMDTLIDFILPPILTISIIPAIYLLMLYSSYDSLFTYIDCILGDNKKMCRCAKKLLLIKCNFRVGRIKNIQKSRVGKLYNTVSKEDIRNILFGYEDCEK